MRAWDRFRSDHPGVRAASVVAGGGPLDDDVARPSPGDVRARVRGVGDVEGAADHLPLRRRPPRGTPAIALYGSASAKVHTRGGERSGHTFAVIRRLGWGVGDQAVSSVANFVLGILVAQVLGAEGFGAFSLAYLTYSFVLSARPWPRDGPVDRPLQRGRATRRGAGRRPRPARPRGWSGSWRVLAASPSGWRSTATTWVTPSWRWACCAPALLLQDSWRFAFFAAGRPAQALANDLVWTLLLLRCWSASARRAARTS